MSKILIVFEKKVELRYQAIIKLIKEYFMESSDEVEEFCVEDSTTQEERRIKLSDIKYDYICTLDLPCFELTTLLEDIAYNILPAKQIHIIIDTKRLLAYKKMDFALNLFVFVPDTGKRYEDEYTHIPNLAVYPIFELGNAQGEDTNRKTLRNILEGVRRECETV